MTVTLRPTDWRDLRVIHRYRSKGLYLDTAEVLTRGSGISYGLLRSFFSPATAAYTWICSDDCGQQPILGQFSHTFESPISRLTFLAPAENLDSQITIDLLEGLARQAGEQGAFYLLAEISEDSSAFESLRRAGFVVYARQRIWKLKPPDQAFQLQIPWKVAASQDFAAAQSLYHSLIPGMVQQIEPLPSKIIKGLVCHDRGELLGYVELNSGPRGILAQPFIHPDTANVEVRLRDMFESVPNRRSRPLFICVRSYQSWLESALDAIGAEPSPGQAVMVKRLVARHAVKRPFALPQIDGHQEVTTPVAQSQRN